MKREDWEKSTGQNFVKFRSKERRLGVRYRAQDAYYHAILSLGAYVPLTEDRRDHNASARLSKNAALAAILKFGRRFLPLYEAAQRELDRRYEASKHGRDVYEICEAMRYGGNVDETRVDQRRKELKKRWKEQNR
jgi:hypothetical protein